jgi:hypothetical protein
LQQGWIHSVPDISTKDEDEPIMKLLHWQHVHSVQQKSSSLKFSKSWTISHVKYSCHHNLSLLLSPCLCIPGISLSSIRYNQSHRVYINQRHQYVRFICV